MTESKEDDVTYRPQAVDYLGFLEAKLRDLQGIDAMVYELIQNADDIRDEAGRPANQVISFDVRDDALIIENEGVFRPVDFERLQRIASGEKREELGTTGAFGIGFLSVYQVTDYPEIFSSDYHWTIRADAQPERRIEERRLTTQATRFRLPWAFDAASPVRRRLRLGTIEAAQLDRLSQEINQAIELAVLFLRQLHTLEVKRQGRLVKRLRRQLDGQQQLNITDHLGQTRSWYLLSGDFETEAAQLHADYAWQIEPGRSCDVRLAIPTAGLDQPGRLFAILPTESTIPLPLYINADFFPTTDRKRITFSDGYQAEWNQAALTAAARVLAANLGALPEVMGYRALWQLLQRLDDTRQMAAQGDLPSVFAAFWQAAGSQMSQQPLVYRADGQWSLPSQARLAQGRSAQAAQPILAALAVPLVHPDLIPYAPLMQRSELAVPELSLDDLATALLRAGFDRPRPLVEAPPFLADLDAWRRLWLLMERLLLALPGDGRAKALARLDDAFFVLTQTGRLERPGDVYRGRTEAQGLFPHLNWLHESIAADSFPGSVTTRFGVSQAVAVLAQTPLPDLEMAWRTGRLDLPGLFRWLESQSIEIFSDDPTLPEQIRRLPLCPVAGELRPLGDLFLPGDFDDPLHLSTMIDLEAVGGRAQFLADLGVLRLDFDTYVRQLLPQVLQQPDLPSDARHQLAQLLAQRLGQIRDDDQLQQQLSQLPLIACLDGHYRPASQVYASRHLLDLLGPQVHIAEPVDSPAQQALHQWLGLSDQPRPADLIVRVRQLAQGPPHEPARKQMSQLLAYLAESWPELSVAARQAYAPLQGLAWLPAQGDANDWHRPEALHTREQASLIASQARFLDAPPALQIPAAAPNGLFEFLGLPTRPELELVARHLAACSQQGFPVDEAVYRYLDAHAADPSLNSLRQSASVHLSGGRYARPDQVYWQEHPFGALRHQLPQELRRYERLFKRLGVRQRPQAWDYIQVLREISQLSLPAQTTPAGFTVRIAWTCWRHLGRLLSQGQLERNELLPLHGLAAIPDNVGQLRTGLDLFLADDLALAQKFAVLSPLLLSATDPARPALEAVGVRPLSQSVQVELVDPPKMTADPWLSQHLQQRRPLLARVLAATAGAAAGGWSLSQLTSLPVKRVETLRLRYRLQRGSQPLASEPETAQASIAGEPAMLYVAGQPGQYLWAALARELAAALRPGGSDGGLASGIKEALAGDTFAEAEQNLDDLGYP